MSGRSRGSAECPALRNVSRYARWLHLDIKEAALVPIAVADFGFEFHHA